MIAPIFCRIAMRSMISGSIAAFRSSVTPSARVAVSSTCSVAPTLGYGRWMCAPCSPFGADSRMPAGSFSTIAPNLRSASRWKSMGRSPIRQPPRSGMNASPSWCSSGPQNRIGIRLDPACASMSAMWAVTTFVGSRIRSPGSVPSVTLTPCTSRRPRTTRTSLMPGTPRRRLEVSPSRDATIAFVTRFFAPRTSMRPRSGTPPSMVMRSKVRPTRSPAFWASVTREFTGSLLLRALAALGADGEGRGSPALPAALEFGDSRFVAQGEGDVVQTLEQPPSGVVVDVERHDDLTDGDLRGNQIDGSRYSRSGIDCGPEFLQIVLGDDTGDQSLLAGVAPEDVAEARAQHDLEAEVAERPDGVLAARSRAEVLAGDQDGGALVLGPVEHEVGVLAPREEEGVLEAGLRDPLEEVGGDDLVGVDVGALERRGDPGVDGEPVHQADTSSAAVADSSSSCCRSHGLDSVPGGGVAGARRGDTGGVRPPLPCRPSKWGLLVEAQRPPGASWWGFMPRHMEQPANRHSAPNSSNTLSRP